MKKSFYNLKYGKCHILEASENLYLVVVVKNYNKFIVCSSIGEMGELLNQYFFEDYKTAKMFYDMKLLQNEEDVQKLNLSPSDKQ